MVWAGLEFQSGRSLQAREAQSAERNALHFVVVDLSCMVCAFRQVASVDPLGRKGNQTHLFCLPSCLGAAMITFSQDSLTEWLR